MSLDFKIGLAMVSPYDDDGFLGVQIDAEGEDQSGVIAYEVISQGGCLYRPLDPVIARDNMRGIDPGQPDPSQSCSVLAGTEGGTGYSWCLNDPRVLANLPGLRPGEAIFFGSFGAFLRFMDDGSAVISTTTDGTMTGGETVQFRFGPTGVLFAAPWGQLRWNASEFVVEGPNIGRLGLEYLGGLPDPLSDFTSTFSVTADNVQIDAGVIEFGGADGTSDGAVKWTPFAALLTEFAGLVQQVATAAATITQATPGATAMVEPLAALEAFSASLTAQLATMKSRTAAG